MADKNQNKAYHNPDTHDEQDTIYGRIPAVQVALALVACLSQVLINHILN